MQIQAKNISKSFSGRLAVDGVTLDIKPGQILGLLGPNGAGKSTTIKMLTGQIKPSAGRLIIDGKEYTHFPEELRDYLGIMPQNIVIWDSLTVLENIQLTASLYNLTNQAARKRTEFLIDSLKLQPELNTLARNLSGGYKRRLNLAISIVHDPQVIFLDEPTPGIDAQSRLLLMDFVKNLASSGKYSIVLTDHYLDEVERLCDYMVIIDHGKVITEGKLRELKTKHGNGNFLTVDLGFEDKMDIEKADRLAKRLMQVFPQGKITGDIFAALTKDVVGDLKETVELITHEKLPLHNISVKEPSLEDIFLLLTGKEVRE